MNKSRQQGFTLIELIIVTILLGILAAIAIPQFTGLSQKARERSAESSDKAVYTQHHAYYAEFGDYPTVTELSSEIENTTPVPTGVQTIIKGSPHVTLTYKDENCTAGEETGAVTDVVKCVDSPSPL